MADVKPFAVKSTDDVFGILALAKTGGGTLANVLSIIGTTLTPIAKSEADNTDEYGDILATEVVGASDDMFEITSEFSLNKGDLVLSDLFLGQCAAADVFSSGVSGKTDNAGWPKLSFTGRMGQTLEAAPTGKLNKWTLPAITIEGRKVAQNFGGGGAGELGFDVDADTSIKSSGIDFTATVTEDTDGEGLPVAFSLHGFKGKLTADLSGFGLMDAKLQPWTLDVAAGFLWKNLQNPSTAKPTAGWWSGSAQATMVKAMTRVVDPA